MSELDERIKAEEERINNVAHERFLEAQRCFLEAHRQTEAAEVRWVKFMIREQEDRRRLWKGVFWAIVISLLGYGLIWLIFAAF
jgi:hypothetical protein